MDERIQAIAEAATRLFLQQGYSNTKISHIAKSTGVSVGTIYLNFAGKKEILHFVLQSTIAPAFVQRTFDRPITDDLFTGLEEKIVEAFETVITDFAEHLTDETYSLEALVSDAFDLLARYAVICLFIEKNQVDFPTLARSYRAYRHQFLEIMAQYITAFVARGMMRPLAQPALTTTLIVEMLSWWAMDVRYTSFETQDIPLSQAKAVCLDNILSAYCI